MGSADAYAGLRARVGDRLPLGVPLLWNRIDRFNPLTELLRGPPPPNPTSTLRCWIDLADLNRATLYFADQRGERFLVRELPLSGRFDEVDQQSVAQVMELSVSALIENAEIGFSRAQAREILERAQQPPPVVVAAAPPAEAPRWHLAAGLFYAFEDLGDALPLAQGPGMILTLGPIEGATGGDAAAGEGASRPAPGVGAWLAGGYQIPIQARQPDVGLRLESLGARVGVDARWWRLQLRLGVGAEFHPRHAPARKRDCDHCPGQPALVDQLRRRRRAGLPLAPRARIRAAAGALHRAVRRRRAVDHRVPFRRRHRIPRRVCAKPPAPGRGAAARVLSRPACPGSVKRGAGWLLGGDRGPLQPSDGT